MTGDSFEHRFRLPAGTTWARAEAYDPGVEEGLEASCEAPEGSDGTTCGGRLTARAMTSAIYLKDAQPEILPVRLLPGSSTRDRTPKLVATVRDAASDLTKSGISLSLDGRKTTFDYDRVGDQLGRGVGPLDYGRHTVKITARDEGGLVATESWGLKVVRR